MEVSSEGEALAGGGYRGYPPIEKVPLPGKEATVLAVKSIIQGCEG
jgi:hypothetical protein